GRQRIAGRPPLNNRFYCSLCHICAYTRPTQARPEPPSGLARGHGMLDSSREAPPGGTGRPLAEFPASFAQERVWLRQRLDPGDPAQNQILAERIDGPLDTGALEHALAQLAARHEAL